MLKVELKQNYVIFKLSMPNTVEHNGLTFGLLYSQEDIEAVVRKVAGQINEYYGNIVRQQGKLDLVIICVLKGAFMFYSDLIKRIEFDSRSEFVRVKSYEGTSSTGKLTVQTQLVPETFAGKSLLFVDDIHDTGHTLKKLMALFQEFKPKRIDAVVLVKRPDKPVTIDLKFSGLVCNDFIVGYGLDLDEWGRHLPQIYQKI